MLCYNLIILVLGYVSYLYFFRYLKYFVIKLLCVKLFLCLELRFWDRVLEDL